MTDDLEAARKVLVDHLWPQIANRFPNVSPLGAKAAASGEVLNLENFIRALIRDEMAKGAAPPKEEKDG